MQSLLCIGHATHDTFLAIDEVNVHCNLDDKTCVVSFDYGAKVPVKKVNYGFGGGSANVAVGTKLLGVDAYLYTLIGNDYQGNDLIKKLKSYGINTNYVIQDQNPTDQASIISYGPDRTIFTYNHDRVYEIKSDTLAKFDNVFVSSIGLNVAKIYMQLIEYKKNNPTISYFYNPGTKELRFANEEVREFATFCDYLIVNIDEACLILNQGLTRRNISIKDLFSLLIQKGIKNPILTDGESGAYFLKNQKLIKTDATPVSVVEKTGAGDAFSAGFIAGILNNKPLENAINWGIKNGASVITKAGAQNGLLNLAEIE